MSAILFSALTKLLANLLVDSFFIRRHDTYGRQLCVTETRPLTTESKTLEMAEAAVVQTCAVDYSSEENVTHITSHFMSVDEIGAPRDRKVNHYKGCILI